MVSESAVDFVRLDLDDLDDVAVVAQSLDNQWVRPDLLAKMLKSGLSLTSDKVARERSRQVRAEYIRSLVNSPQVVINRAYIINNPVVRRDFLKGRRGERSSGTSWRPAPTCRSCGRKSHRSSSRASR
jgi:hypothetical protein